MYNLSKAYHYRPSLLLDLPYNSWEAYLVDAQCYVAGIEHEKEANSNDNSSNNPMGNTDSDKSVNPWLNIGNVRTINDSKFTGIW